MERSSAYLLRGDGSASLGGCGVGCVCLLFLVSPRSAWFDRVCSLAGAHCTPLSLPPPSYPPLLSSSALPTSLSFFLIPSFILSAHIFLGEAKRSHSSHNPPPEAPPSLSLSPSFFQSITLSLSPPLSPFFLSLIHFFFCLVSTSVLSLPLFLYPQPPFSSPSSSSVSLSLSPPVPWQTLASHDPHSLLHTHIHTHTRISQHGETWEYHRVAHVFHSVLGTSVLYMLYSALFV